MDIGDFLKAQPRRRLFALVVAALGITTALSCIAPAKADEAGNPASEILVRRLTPSQYRQIISDVFGDTTKIGGRFEPDIREDGLLAVGTGHVSVTAAGLEQYDMMARSIAAQVVDEQHRATIIPCRPKSDTDADPQCAGQFFSKVGRFLFRRPLTAEELRVQVDAASAAAKTVKNFYSGLSLSLASMLDAPQFLFRRETVEVDPDHAGAYRLDAYSKASQLSFFLWNTSPDAELLRAAETGELNTEKGLARQVDRMSASPRLEDGVRAFFSDMLGFDEFATLAKDAMIYPKYTPEISAEAQEQTLRTIVDLLLTQKGDYRDLFTTRKTFLTPLLASVYRIPLPSPNGLPATWAPYDYPENADQAGILTEAAFVALHSHPGRSSPTIRGKAVRQILLCQKVPDPPGNVNFKIVQETDNPQYRTARERLTAHRADPVCAGCHKIMDPIGLAMENFDSSGGFRVSENGAPIDAGGELDGMKFTDAAGLGKAVHDDPATSSCVVGRIFSYAIGRPVEKNEGAWMRNLQADFAKNGYRLPDLMRAIATSDVLYRAAAPQMGAADLTTGR